MTWVMIVGVMGAWDVVIAVYHIAVPAETVILVICASGDLSASFTIIPYIGAPLTKTPALSGAQAKRNQTISW